MVEQSINYDNLFRALADATRRDILARVAEKDLSISSLAKPYTMSFAAIAKHVSVLELAKLITKRRVGKEQIISAAPRTINQATKYLEVYEKTWNGRFDALENLLKNK